VSGFVMIDPLDRKEWKKDEPQRRRDTEKEEKQPRNPGNQEGRRICPLSSRFPGFLSDLSSVFSAFFSVPLCLCGSILESL
jgi:hypothetical protein